MEHKKHDRKSFTYKNIKKDLEHKPQKTKDSLKGQQKWLSQQGYLLRGSSHLLEMRNEFVSQGNAHEAFCWKKKHFKTNDDSTSLDADS